MFPGPASLAPVRRLLLVLWLALGASLPGSANLKLCFCDGLSGLWTPGACATAQRDDASAASSCCAGTAAREDADGPAASSERPQACACLRVETEPCPAVVGKLRDGGVVLLGSGAAHSPIWARPMSTARASVLPAPSGRSNGPRLVPLRI